MWNGSEERRRFRAGFPVDAGTAELSFIILVRLCVGEEHSCKHGDTSGLREGSGADITFKCCSKYIRKRYRFEFEIQPLSYPKVRPDTLCDVGASDAAACAVAAAQGVRSMADQDWDDPLVLISCACGCSNLGCGIANLQLERVTSESDHRRARNSLLNKWHAAVANHAVALVLHEDDAAILAEALPITALPLSENCLRRPAQSLPLLLSCRSEQLPLLMEELGGGGFLRRESPKMRKHVATVVMVLLVLAGFGLGIIFTGLITKNSSPPTGWPQGLWAECWNRQERWLDFTAASWLKLDLDDQIRHSRAYQRWYAREYHLRLEKQWPVGKVTIPMVLVPPGRFYLGSPRQQLARNHAEAGRRVVTKAFYIGKCEIDQRQWRAATGKQPAYFRGPNLPVEQVDWRECQNFCQRIGLELPSATQWEYACRASTTTPFNVSDRTLATQINYDGNYPYARANRGQYRGKTVAVGSLDNANAWGIHDCHGNVGEWCRDRSHYYRSNDRTFEMDNRRKTAQASGEFAVVRGGSWNDGAGYCRAVDRRYELVALKVRDIGLRVVLPDGP